MIPQMSLTSIRMNKSTQRTAINHQPRNKCAELLRSKEVDLEHACDVRSNGPVEEFVDAELGD